MRRFLEVTLAALVVSGTPLPSWASVPVADGVDFSGQVRIREEFSNHVYQPVDPGGNLSYDFAHMRTRLGLEAVLNDQATLIVELQDVRNLGEEGSTTAALGRVDVKQGMIQLLGDELGLDVGRFVLQYGDERVIGAADWNDPGRSFDGIVGHYDAEGGEYLDLFVTRIRESQFDEEDQGFLGFYGRSPALGPDLEAYVLYLRDRFIGVGELMEGDTWHYTAGARLASHGSPIDYTFEGAYQSGSLRSDDLSAWGFAGKGGYTTSGGWETRFGGEVAVASGNEKLGDGSSEQFQVLFPTNHMLYGLMDIAAWSNIVDLKASVTVKPSQVVSLLFEYHYLELMESAGGWINASGQVIRPGVEGASTQLGHEVDLRFEWKAMERVGIIGGVSGFLPGDFVEETGASPNATFSYFQIKGAL